MSIRLCCTLVAVLLASPAFAVSIQDAKKTIADSLKDPDSVKFRNVKKSDRTGAVCGEFNAKNSFGAYVGFSPFGVTADGTVMDAPDTEGLNAAYAAESIRHFLAQCDGAE